MTPSQTLERVRKILSAREDESTVQAAKRQVDAFKDTVKHVEYLQGHINRTNRNRRPKVLGIVGEDGEPRFFDDVYPATVEAVAEANGGAKADAADAVNHPAHYTAHPSGVEAITICEHMNFCLGNAMKYLFRAGLKGDMVEDLKKARWYIDREIARLART